jgi:hypothetical protein
MSKRGGTDRKKAKCRASIISLATLSTPSIPPRHYRHGRPLGSLPNEVAVRWDDDESITVLGSGGLMVLEANRRAPGETE